MTTLNDILESADLQQVVRGMGFTEGPLWHPDGFFYFVDLPANLLYRMVLGQAPEKVRTTEGGNGTTFDLQGRLLNCEGDGRKVTRLAADGSVSVVADRFEGKRLSRPNDVICHSNGNILFTDPDFRVPLEQREIGNAAVYKVTPDGTVGRRHQWRAGRDENRRGRAGVLHRHRRRLGIRAGRQPGRDHRHAGGLRQYRVRWPRPADAAADRLDIGLYAAHQGSWPAASLVPASRIMSHAVSRC
jgi:hypothetical protein